MSFAELEPINMNNNKKTITIQPYEPSYIKFKQIVKKQYGSGKESMVICQLINHFNNNATQQFKYKKDYQLKKKVTLYMDLKIWNDFSDKVMRLFSKNKIKSAIISSLIEKYIKDITNFKQSL